MNAIVRTAVLIALAGAIMMTMPLILQARADEKLASITIGITSTDHFAACADEQVAINVASATGSRDTPKQRNTSSSIWGSECGEIAGALAHKVVYHIDVKDGIVKVVIVSLIADDGKPGFAKKVYVVRQREVIGSGIKEKIAGVES